MMATLAAVESHPVVLFFGCDARDKSGSWTLARLGLAAERRRPHALPAAPFRFAHGDCRHGAAMEESDDAPDSWQRPREAFFADGPEPWRAVLHELGRRDNGEYGPKLALEASEDDRARWEEARAAACSWLVDGVRSGEIEARYAEGIALIPNMNLRDTLEFVLPLRISPHTWDIESLTTRFPLRMLTLRRVRPAKISRAMDDRHLYPRMKALLDENSGWSLSRAARHAAAAFPDKTVSVEHRERRLREGFAKAYPDHPKALRMNETGGKIGAGIKRKKPKPVQ
jgi:hypothetical protein